jgi:hypothetical protein
MKSTVRQSTAHPQGKIPPFDGSRLSGKAAAGPLMPRNEALTVALAWLTPVREENAAQPPVLGRRGTKRMDTERKPLAKVEGRRRMRRSGLMIAWRGTPDLDDWVAYIVGTKAKKSVFADHASDRKVKTLLSRLQTMSKKEIGQIAKG